MFRGGSGYGLITGRVRIVAHCHEPSDLASLEHDYAGPSTSSSAHWRSG